MHWKMCPKRVAHFNTIQAFDREPYRDDLADAAVQPKGLAESGNWKAVAVIDSGKNTRNFEQGKAMLPHHFVFPVIQ